MDDSRGILDTARHHAGRADPQRLARFFAPRSLAIVGASETAYWSRNAITNLMAAGFGGPLALINPKRKTVFGRDCVGSLRDVTSAVDLAYIAVPPEAVPAVLEDAASAGIGNAVIIAAGFGETGADGRTRQAALVEHAGRAGVLVLGPNCPGFINFSANVSAYGQQIPADMQPGGVSIVLQSGALASVVMKFSQAHGVGLSKVICMGNEAAVGAVDVMEYLIADDDTRVIAMFLEQIRDGSRFLDLAHRALIAGKAIVVLKAGRTAAGQMAALAHTGAVAGDEAVIDAALRQAGVVRVRSLEELLMSAGLLARGLDLKGPRIAVVTASGGACDIIADRASDEGLEMPAFSPETAAELTAYLPDFATVQNPLDTAAVDTVRTTAGAAVPMDVVAEIVSRDANVDVVLYMGFNVVPQATPDEPGQVGLAARMRHVGDMIRQAPVPIVGISLTCLDVGSFARGLYDRNDIPMLGGIEFGLMALGHAIRWQRAHTGAADRADRVGTAPSLSSAKPRRGPWSEAEGRALLEANGVPLVPASLVLTADEAAAAAERHGFPVVLKICSAEIAHKSDIGGVVLNVRDAQGVRAAFAAVDRAGRAAAGDGIDGVLVSPMRPRGVELFAGITVDPTFGPTLAVGLGGIWIETLKDVALRVLPVTEGDVRSMLRSLQGSALLDGARGGPKVDHARAAQAIVRIAQAALSLGPDLHALEVNPLWCLDDRVEALDALVVIVGEDRDPPRSAGTSA